VIDKFVSLPKPLARGYNAECPLLVTVGRTTPLSSGRRSTRHASPQSSWIGKRGNRLFSSRTTSHRSYGDKGQLLLVRAAWWWSQPTEDEITNIAVALLPYPYNSDVELLRDTVIITGSTIPKQRDAAKQRAERSLVGAIAHGYRYRRA